MLELKDVRFSVTDEKGQLKNIINGINLKIDEGKFVAITGPNGSGKSTLAKLIVGIGEIGLDYHYEDTDKEIQRMVFNRQLEIAEKFNKPVVVHSRDSIGETYNILSKYNLKGSIHCYSGSLEMAKLFIKLGYKLGVGGIITFKNAKNIKEVVKNVDLSYILLETDSPYLSPEPYRGSENNPSNIPVIAESIASIKGVANIDVARVTTANAEEVFDFL